MIPQIPLSDDETRRYNRQIVLKSIDFDGQETLKGSRILIVGLGGLGCAASQYLASAGVGHLTLVDFDTVSLSNLQRQVLHRDSTIGQAKVISAKQQLEQLNPHCEIQAIHAELSAAQWHVLIPTFHAVVDCTDNVTIRNQLNQSCFQHNVPLISGAAIRFEGQVSVFRYHADEPCYTCLSQLFGQQTLSCVESGVIAPIVGVVGSLQAIETIKILLNIGKPLSGKLLMIDTLNFNIREMTLPRNPNCEICGENDSNIAY